MEINFKEVPEYLIFKDLTTLDEMFGRVVIDPSIKPQFFKPEERKEAFLEVLKQFKENGFYELYDEYCEILKHKTYSSFKNMDRFKNFTFNHPLVVMLHMFIEQGLLTKDLEYGDQMKCVNLGEKVYSKEELEQLSVSEGIIFADGTLLRIFSNEAHKIGALWMFLNGRRLFKAIRFTTDCINPEPIFLSMGEYAKLDSNNVKISEEQAYAIYNIYRSISLKKRCKPFLDVLETSTDLCITSNTDAQIRYSNAKTLQRCLGEEIFNAKEVLEDLKFRDYLR